MQHFKSRRMRKPDMNITSLIDVVFILLIFFMIGSTFEKPVMKVALPEAESGKPVQTKSIEVLVSKEGGIVAENRRFTAEELEVFLKERVLQNPETTVFLSCDSELVFQQFVSVMDILNKSGIKNAAVKHEYSKK